MIDARRNLDGSYDLRIFDHHVFRFYTAEDTRRWPHDPPNGRDLIELGGRWVGDAGPNAGHWVVPESAVARIGAHRIFVVVLAGYCCGKPSGAEVRGHDVARGMVLRVLCRTCGGRSPFSTLWNVPIVEVCGEGEEGRLTFEAAFRGEVEPL